MASLFPHLTATGPPPTSLQVMDAYRQAFATRVAERSLRPLVMPYHLYGYLVLVLYLCIPHAQRPWVYTARWPVLAGIWWFQWKTLWEDTSMSMAMGFASGLMAAWGAVLSFVWLVLYKPQAEAKRVNTRPRKMEADEEKETDDEIHHDRALKASNGSASHAKPHFPNSEHDVPNGNGVIRKRKQENGDVKREENGNAVARKNSRQLSYTHFDYDPTKDDTIEHYWQGYPESFGERFKWVLDLVINFRLPGWNLAIPPMPALSPSIKEQLGEPVDAASRSGVSSVGLKRFETRRQLLKARLPVFVVGYFLLDVLKVLMMNDPYFIFGPTTYQLPSYLQGCSPLALKFIRQSISTYSIIISLEMVFLLPPLMMSILFGPRVFGDRAHAWYFPTTWGSWSNVMNKGLNGLWGSWWHQTFRFAFSAPSNFLINNGYIPAHSFVARMLALFFAFGISGILHSGGSVSQFPKTFPTHAAIFFMMQALGILIQSTLCSVLHPLIQKFPRKVRRMGNFTFTFVWLLYTGFWLTDDFARGGIWLYEPIPISPLRGLGFGEKDAGWWCWDHPWVGWYSGKHWWESGLAF